MVLCMFTVVTVHFRCVAKRQRGLNEQVLLHMVVGIDFQTAKNAVSQKHVSKAENIFIWKT